MPSVAVLLYQNTQESVGFKVSGTMHGFALSLAVHVSVKWLRMALLNYWLAQSAQRISNAVSKHCTGPSQADWTGPYSQGGRRAGHQCKHPQTCNFRSASASKRRPYGTGKSSLTDSLPDVLIISREVRGQAIATLSPIQQETPAAACLPDSLRKQYAGALAWTQATSCRPRRHSVSR